MVIGTCKIVQSITIFFSAVLCFAFAICYDRSWPFVKLIVSQKIKQTVIKYLAFYSCGIRDYVFTVDYRYSRRRLAKLRRKKWLQFRAENLCIGFLIIRKTFVIVAVITKKLMHVLKAANNSLEIEESHKLTFLPRSFMFKSIHYSVQ